MPLLHRDNGRGTRGSASMQDLNVNRRSLADLLYQDTSRASPSANAPSHSSDYGAEGFGRWADASSPEAAQTPRSMVPAACFPPRHTKSYASYSENAQIDARWRDDSSGGHGMTALVSSLESMKIPSQNRHSMYASVPPSMSVSYDQLEKVGNQPWPPEQARTSVVRSRSKNYLSRRASFCGTTSASREWIGGSTSANREWFAYRDDMMSVWIGELPNRCIDPVGGFSTKVFLGGLPWDISEQSLLATLQPFRPVRVEWPGRETGGALPRGYAYMTLENEHCVRSLLSASRCDGQDWFYRITSRKMRNKEVQVIPWAVSDSNWVSGGSARLESSRTVFVGALHGMLSASALAMIMNCIFSGVVYAGIDTDKNKYPIGSGRVTFNNVHSYILAISSAFLEIRTSKFTKKIQIDPYLEDSICSVCKLRQGPYFCRDPTCFGYFCRSCWLRAHVSKDHKPLTRNSKSSHQYNGLHTLAVLPATALPALPAPPTSAINSEELSFYNGYNMNEGTPSPPSTSGLNALSPPFQPQACFGSEVISPSDQNWRR